MGITQQQGFTAIPYMILCGILCGVFYDSIRLIRILLGALPCKKTTEVFERFCLPIPRFSRADTSHTRTLSGASCIRRIIVGFGDILNGIFFGCLFSIFLAHYACGVFRWFFLAASAFGFGVYYATVGRAVMLSAAYIVGCFRVVACFALWILLLPFRVLVRAFRFLGRAVERHIIRPLMERVEFFHGLRYTEQCRKELVSDINLFYERGE